MSTPLATLITTDGALFVFIGLVVMVTPSPQPALVVPVDDVALPPFKDTRRLLAALFIASGLLLLVFGLRVTDPRTLELVAWARLLSFSVVAGVNLSQVRGNRWKRPPLFVLLGSWIVLGALYCWWGVLAH